MSYLEISSGVTNRQLPLAELDRPVRLELDGETVRVVAPRKLDVEVETRDPPTAPDPDADDRVPVDGGALR